MGGLGRAHSTPREGAVPRDSRPFCAVNREPWRGCCPDRAREAQEVTLSDKGGGLQGAGRRTRGRRARGKRQGLVVVLRLAGILGGREQQGPQGTWLWRKAQLPARRQLETLVRQTVKQLLEPVRQQRRKNVITCKAGTGGTGDSPVNNAVNASAQGRLLHAHGTHCDIDLAFGI